MKDQTFEFDMINHRCYTHSGEKKEFRLERDLDK